jgi:hypothetical protein
VFDERDACGRPVDSSIAAERPRLIPMGIVNKAASRVPTWAANAECRGHRDVNLFPKRGASPEPAKVVCAAYRVRRARPIRRDVRGSDPCAT